MLRVTLRLSLAGARCGHINLRWPLSLSVCPSVSVSVSFFSFSLSLFTPSPFSHHPLPFQSPFPPAGLPASQLLPSSFLVVPSPSSSISLFLSLFLFLLPPSSFPPSSFLLPPLPLPSSCRSFCQSRCWWIFLLCSSHFEMFIFVERNFVCNSLLMSISRGICCQHFISMAVGVFPLALSC